MTLSGRMSPTATTVLCAASVFLRRLYNDIAQALVTEYSARTGKDDIESYAMASYDSIMLIAQAIEDSGSTDPADIIDALGEHQPHGRPGSHHFSGQPQQYA